MVTSTKDHVRWIIRADLERIVAIERTFWSENAWGEDQFLRALKEKNTVGLAVERGECVVGYLIYVLERGRYLIGNIGYVDPQACCTMIDHLKEKMVQTKRNRIVIYVHERNLSVQLMFRAMGFAWVRTEWDEYVMVYREGQ